MEKKMLNDIQLLASYFVPNYNNIFTETMNVL